MTSPSPGVTGTQDRGPRTARRLPPEERFWQRYSPHHEFPLSSTTSVAVHVLVLAFLSVAAWAAVHFGLVQDNEPVDVTPVFVEGGGGGNPRGAGEGPGAPGVGLGDEVVPDAPAPPAPPVPDLNPGAVAPPQVHPEKDGHRPVSAEQVQRKLDAVASAARARLSAPLGGSPGQGGPGTGGGSGPGNGRKPGPGTGDGDGRPNERQERVLRWRMTFNTRDGEDYLRQLRDLRPGGAILAVPTGDGGYRVFRDLTRRPAVGQVEDVTQLRRIFWIDEQPESVAGLARALGIPRPAYFVAFFTPEQEAHLAALEKARLDQDHPSHTVHDIAETHFAIIPVAGGFEPRVSSVVLKP